MLGPLRLLRYRLRLCQSLHLIPFRFIKSSNRVNVKEVPLGTFLLWLALCLLPLLQSLLDLTLLLHRATSPSITSLIFHGFLLVCRTSPLLALLSIHLTLEDHAHLINSLLSEKPSHSNSSSFWFSSILLSFVLTIGLTIPLGTSLFSSFNPCQHHPTYGWLLHCNAGSVGPFGKMLVLALQLGLMAHFSVLASTYGCVCLLPLYSLHKRLTRLRLLVGRWSRLHTCCWKGPLLSAYYRQAQLYSNLLNSCLQSIMFPAIQTNGTLAIIPLLYSLLIFHPYLTRHTLLLLLTLLFSVLGFCLATLDIGSLTLLTSKRMLAKSRKLFSHCPREQCCKQSRLFLRSCRPISIGVGPFHKMDRGRGPALIKFCLQRTLLLVVNTRTTATK